MSVADEILRLQQAKSDLATSIENKGVTVPAATTLDGYAALVDQIQQGGSSLPYDAEIEYVETNGSVLVCTGVYPESLNLTIEYNTMNNMLFGWFYNNQANNTWIGSAGNIVYWKNWNSSYRYSVSNYNDGTWNTWKYDMQTGFYKNNVLLKSFAASLGNSQISSIPLYIGNYYDRNAGNFRAVAESFTVKIKTCKIYSGGTMVRNYIPVRIGNAGYLYDKVSDTLFCGQGKSSFTLGPDVI